MVDGLGRHHMRTHYFARSMESTPRHLRDVPSRIAVAVREDTTFLAREPMLPPGAEVAASRACFGRESRIDVDDGETDCLRLVFDEGLKLSPGPTVQARSHALPSFDSGANVRQILHRDRAAAGLDRLRDDLGANLMVDVSHMTRLSAGDSCQQLSCRLRAVALKPPAKRQETIARIAKLSTSIQIASVGSRRHVFTQINAEHGLLAGQLSVGQVERDVKIPAPTPFDKFRLFDGSAIQIRALKATKPHRYALATVRRKERYVLADQTVGTRIEMHCSRGTEGNLLPRATVSAVRFEAARYRRDGVTRHLRAQRWEGFTQPVVDQMVQAHAIGTTVFQRHAGSDVASSGEDRPQSAERQALIGARHQCNRNRALHVLYCTTQKMKGAALPPWPDARGFRADESQ